MTSSMVIKIAFRSIFLHRMKTIIVGFILILGAFLSIVGNSFVDAIAQGMRKSITQSISGDIQIHSKSAKDKLSIFGNMDGSLSDVGFLDNLAKIRQELMELDNVQAVIPMGINHAIVNPGNILDIKLEQLRNLYKQNMINKVSKSIIETKKDQIKFLIKEIQKNFKTEKENIFLLSNKELETGLYNLNLALKDSLWKNFDANFEQKIDFLANKIAPLIFDDNQLYLSYVGTNPTDYKKFFPQFEIVKGEIIPSGERGFLFHDYFFENTVKHRTARRLDQIKKQIEQDQETIAKSKTLQDKIKANQDQLAEIYLQLDPIITKKLHEKLKQFLKIDEPDFRKILMKFFDMKDEDFLAKYSFFYTDIAPHLILYKMNIGDIIPINAFTKYGSSSSINVKVFGTFRFKSFENSPLSGAFNLIDLISFRKLYGFMTEEHKKENLALQKEMAILDVDKNNIEKLFQDASAEPLNKNLKKQFKKEDFELSLQKNQKTISNHYLQKEIDNGIFLHGAIILKDPLKLKESLDKINLLSNQNNLSFKAISWQDASGIVGQMTFFMKVLLYLFISILITIAGLMILNSLLMVTMDRKQEIGTMRAIGASKIFIYKSLFYESLILSIFFGLLGSVLGFGTILLINQHGISAQGDVMLFFFSGPKLYLTIDYMDFVFIILTMIVISLIATQYPAWKAMQISPLQAMQKNE